MEPFLFVTFPVLNASKLEILAKRKEELLSKKQLTVVEELEQHLIFELVTATTKRDKPIRDAVKAWEETWTFLVLNKRWRKYGYEATVAKFAEAVELVARRLST